MLRRDSHLGQLHGSFQYPSGMICPICQAVIRRFRCAGAAHFRSPLLETSYVTLQRVRSVRGPPRKWADQIADWDSGKLRACMVDFVLRWNARCAAPSWRPLL